MYLMVEMWPLPIANMGWDLILALTLTVGVSLG